MGVPVLGAVFGGVVLGVVMQDPFDNAETRRVGGSRLHRQYASLRPSSEFSLRLTGREPCQKGLVSVVASDVDQNDLDLLGRSYRHSS